MINNNFSTPKSPKFPKQIRIIPKAKAKTKNIYVFLQKIQTASLFDLKVQTISIIISNNPEQKITIPGHIKLTFGKKQINNG